MKDLNNNYKGGILNVIETSGIADEKQGRKTLHEHNIAYIKNFNNLCIFSDLK